ncbi:MAG: hypothetical protein JWM57_1985 [Phycisphaerales bacterium]|nr:hypothetical protein [Phycisphaerales bacterium]
MSAEADLARQSKWKRTVHPASVKIGGDVLSCFKVLEKRHKKFGRIGEAWLQLVPPALQERSELMTYAKGSLGVIVEGGPHLFMLKQALLNGLQEQLLLACRSEGLKKIVLKAGRLSA